MLNLDSACLPRTAKITRFYRRPLLPLFPYSIVRHIRSDVFYPQRLSLTEWYLRGRNRSRLSLVRGLNAGTSCAGPTADTAGNPWSTLFPLMKSSGLLGGRLKIWGKT